MRDMVLQIPSDGQIEIGNTGFRFVRIDLLSSDFTIHLKEAPAILRYRNIPYLGSFRCNDERLNEIGMTGAYTVHLNMQEYLWDGIKRDRLIWLGDMHPEVATIMSVFGYNEVVNKSIDLACEQFPLPQWLNGISTYSMWYLIIHHEWYMHNGNISFLQRHRNYITGVIDRIDECVDEEISIGDFVMTGGEIPAMAVAGEQLNNSGPGLIFITLPNIFNAMDGGILWGTLFFVFMSCAALSTVIGVFENIISYSVDVSGMPRRRACAVHFVCLWLASLPCALGFNLLADFQPLGPGTCVLDLEDFLLSNNLLPFGCLLFLLFCSWRRGWGWDNFVAEVNQGQGVRFPRFMKYYLRYGLPCIILLVFVMGYVDKFGK